MKKLIVVADWVDDSLACMEVRSSIEGYLKNPSSPAGGPNISFVSSTPSTIHTSFLISQIVETEERYGRPLDTVLFQNTDPMKEHTVESGGIGAELFIMRLLSGIYVIGPNAGYVFSMIKPKVEEVFHYKDLAMTGQFRSRDIFSRISAYFMDSLQDDLELDEVHSDLIPQLEGYYIGHIDNFGNIKTTISESALKGKYSLGQDVPVTINTITLKARYVKNLYDGTPNSLVIYPGSSGSPDEPYLEISKFTDFSQNATYGMREFNNAKPGMEIQVG